jgi:hypothetical protein
MLITEITLNTYASATQTLLQPWAIHKRPYTLRGWLRPAAFKA